MRRESSFSLLGCLLAFFVAGASPCDAQTDDRPDLRRQAAGGAELAAGAPGLRTTDVARHAYAYAAVGVRSRPPAGRRVGPRADRRSGLFALERRAALSAGAGTPRQVAVLEEVSVPGFLPAGLRTDLVDLKADLEELATVVFGRKGIVRFGRVGETDQPRLRLNLQTHPDPGLAFVLLTR